LAPASLCPDHGFMLQNETQRARDRHGRASSPLPAHPRIVQRAQPLPDVNPRYITEQLRRLGLGRTKHWSDAHLCW
jgi:hypothetical protein